MKELKTSSITNKYRLPLSDWAIPVMSQLIISKGLYATKLCNGALAFGGGCLR